MLRFLDGQELIFSEGGTLLLNGCILGRRILKRAFLLRCPFFAQSKFRE